MLLRGSLRKDGFGEGFLEVVLRGYFRDGTLKGIRLLGEHNFLRVSPTMAHALPTLFPKDMAHPVVVAASVD